MSLLQPFPEIVLARRPSAGIVKLIGNDCLDLLHRLSTNDLNRLKPGDVRATVLTTNKGRIVDYVHVVVDMHHVYIITSTNRDAIVKDWIDKFTIMEDVSTSIETNEWILHSLIGNNFDKTADALRLRHDGVGRAFIDQQAINYTVTEFGTTVLNILTRTESAEGIERDLQFSAKNIGIPILDTVQYEVFRIARGIPSAPGEIHDMFNPYEVRLRDAISFSKGCYVGQEVIARLDTYQKVHRHMVGFLIQGTLPVLKGVRPVYLENDEVGWITSMVPEKNRSIGIGVVQNQIMAGETLNLKETGMPVGMTVSGFPLPYSLGYPLE